MSGRRFLGTIPTANYFSLPFSVTERFHWICHAYCLMDNHYHLVIETPDGNFPRVCASSMAFTLKLSIDATAESGIYFRGGLRESWFRKRAIFSKSAAM